MSTPDLNLLITLDVLLSEGSVAGAAKRLQLSPSAMSRSLARLRETMADPLLVRAGRGLVPTPRALQIREQVTELVLAAKTILAPAERLDLHALTRTFAIRASDGFVENFAAALLARVRAQAPNVKLRFVQKVTKDHSALRDGHIDLDIGVVGRDAGPEIRSRVLFQDQFVGVVHRRHPLAQKNLTTERYLQAEHVHVSRRGLAHGPVDEALAALGKERHVMTTVGGYPAALALARDTDLVATVPAQHTGNLRDGLFSFPLPFAVPEINISMLWHPRMDADQAHRWLRECLREVCNKAISIQ